jgi:purine-nucleoside phosphorylase
MLHEIKVSVDTINKKTNHFEPEIGIVLGTGFIGFLNQIDIEYEIMYSSIPNLPISTINFHVGKLVFGTLMSKRVVVMVGKFHFYEGFSMSQISFPIRVLKLLGIKHLLITNSSISVNPEYQKGDIVILEDHINLQADNPLRGLNIDGLGSRFPSMAMPYYYDTITKAEKIATLKDIKLKKGIYACITGPSRGTPAEYRYLKTIGADIVGMSTVPEVIVANHMELPVFALSIITDEGFSNIQEPIIDTSIEPKVNIILKELVSLL